MREHGFVSFGGTMEEAGLSRGGCFEEIMNGVEAVIFDLGNVLLAYDEERAAERLAARTGKTRREIGEFAQHAVRDRIGIGQASKVKLFHTVARDPAFDGTYEEFALLWCDIFTPIEPMIALAESLKTRVPRLLLSNTNAIHIDFVLEHYPFLNEFDAHVSTRGRPAQARRGDLPAHAGQDGLTAGRDCVSRRHRRQRGRGPARRHAGGADRDFGQAREELTKLGVSPI